MYKREKEKLHCTQFACDICKCISFHLKIVMHFELNWTFEQYFIFKYKCLLSNDNLQMYNIIINKAVGRSDYF